MAGTVSAGLHGALLLARGRADGLLLVATDAQGARRSFIAAAICLPAFVCLRLLGWVQDHAPPHAEHAFALDLLGYAIGWAGFALISLPIARLLGRAHRWPLFVSAWNWCNVVQYLLLVAAGIPALLGAPGVVDQTAQLIALGWALWLEYYATRLALDVSRVAAIGLVVLDIAIGLFLSALSAPLSAAGVTG
jgi:hypothetical protein